MMHLALLAQSGEVRPGFGEQQYVDQTMLHPVGLAAILVLGFLTLILPRKQAIFPMVIMACFVSPAQRVVLFTLDFHLLRLLVLFAWVRLFARGELRLFQWRRMDTWVCAWAVVSALVYILRVRNFGAVVFRTGNLYDVLGMYFFFRCVLQQWGDLDRLVRLIAWLSIPVSLLFIVEKLTGHNPFAFLGGVPHVTVIREGRLRAQGPFPHAILAGCFYAAWLPYMLALRHRPGGLLLAVMGFAAMMFIVFACSSSTPIGGVLGVVVGSLLWVLRRRMRLVRWATWGTLAGLHMVMKQPVWHLISRISFSKGSTSYHRFLLMDNAIRNWREWYRLGLSSTAHWGYGMFDLTNQYVREGVEGGLISLVLFVGMLAHAYGLVGRTWRSVADHPAKRAYAWAGGVALFAHTLMFFSISVASWCQQNLFGLVLLYAVIASYAPRREPKKERELSRDEN